MPDADCRTRLWRDADRAVDPDREALMLLLFVIIKYRACEAGSLAKGDGAFSHMTQVRSAAPAADEEKGTDR